MPAFVGAGWGRADSGRPVGGEQQDHPGPAEACGVATMRLGEDVMEVEEWCRAEPALLVELDQSVYIPLAARGPAE